ncbi:uncharacterized protein C8orf74 homolog isoform X2 [Toxotes jaculatrix]|uniref:uncharacterized protein C8orf74 homolog isoform X2 n=1 Tax=Toxotes jaculatrix TaxID=941984 RepID=UPI001B3B1503|nr:uncharacterized protein C8orf74 homolog isoform X2 [Toxotes jaculatrix]
MSCSPTNSPTQTITRDAGVQRLSCHFSWPEFCDERRCFHQEFVYDVSMFASAQGFPWSDVIRTAVIAKSIFPQLDGLDTPDLLSLLRDTLSECLPDLTPVHRHKFTQFLSDTFTTRRRLFQATVGGAANLSITELHLEVQLPPTPCPLAQGTELHQWEHQQQQTQLTSALQQKEEELRSLRDGLRVTLGDIPEDVQLDKEGVLDVVRAAVSATEGQMLSSLNQEVSLLSDILQLKLQQASLATRRLHNPVPSNTGLRPDTPAKTKTQTVKTKTGLKQ